MRKNWKRILAGAIATCMILGDSSLAFATENAQVIAEEVVESMEVTEKLTLNGESVKFFANESRIFEITEPTTTFAKLIVSGDYSYNLTGDSCYFFVDYSESGENEYILTIPAGNTVYFEINAETEGSITYCELVTSKIEFGETKIVESGTSAYFEFVPDEKQQSFFGDFEYVKNISIVGNDGEEYSNFYGCPYTDTMGNSLYLLPRMKNIEKVIFSVEVPENVEAVNVTLNHGPTEQMVINEWTGYIELQPGEVKYVTYSGKNHGEYFLSIPEDVYEETYGWSKGMQSLGEECFSIDGQYYEGYGVWDNYDLEKEANIEFKLSNRSNETKVVLLFSNEDFESETIELDEEYIVSEKNYDKNKEAYFGYYKFVPDETGLYEIDGELGWAYCKRDGNPRFKSRRTTLLEEGETYLFKFEQESDDRVREFQITKSSVQECYGTVMEFGRLQFCKFIPSESGIFGIEEDEYFAIYDSEKDEWKDSYEYESEVHLTAGETYYIEGYKGNFGLKNKITVLDYDYYHALIASGGSVSVDTEGNVVIEDGTNEFTLWEKILNIFGMYDYSELKSYYPQANYYWKSPEAGEFAASEIYDLQGREISYNWISDDAVVLVKYEPEIVWAENLEVRIENESLATGDTTYLYVTATPATEKYPFEDVPQLRISTNDVLNVGACESITWSDDNHAVTLKYPVTAAKSGKAQITVFADEDLRYQEGLSKKILSEKVNLIVGQKYQISYDMGKVEAVIGENPETYVAGNSYVLTAPVPVKEGDCGYTFAGWYSDANFKTKVTQITGKMTGNQVFYAKWIPTEYKINYDYAFGFNPTGNPASYTVETDTIELKNIVLAGYQVTWHDLESGELVTAIEKGSVGDVHLLAKYECTAEFLLKVSSTEVERPYNGESYDPATVHFNVESKTQGYYVNETGLNIQIYKDGMETADANVLPDCTIAFYEEGIYTIKGSYNDEGAMGSIDRELEEIVVTVKNELPPPAIAKEVTWAEASNLRPGLTYKDIKAEIEGLLVQDNNLLTYEREVVIKDSKGVALKDTDLVKSGNYTIVYKLAENETYQSKAKESKLTINYSPITFKGFVGVPATLDGNRDEERVAEMAIAYPVEVDGRMMNASAYPERLVLWPDYDTPWGVKASAEMEYFLAERGYEAVLEWSEVVPAGKNAILAPYTGIGGGNEYSLDVKAAGQESGTRDIKVTLVIKDTVDITSTIKKFAVKSGAENIVKNIDLKVANLEPLFTTGSGEAQYVISQSNEEATYTLNAKSIGYETEEVSSVLTWKNSNTKVVKLKDNKDGTVTLTIPGGVSGISTITVSSKDAGKATNSISMIVADTSVRLDTVKTTINSAMDQEFIVYLYPNLYAASGIVPELKVEVVDKDGNANTSGIFKVDEHDIYGNKGYLYVSLAKVPEKSGTHTVYLKVTQLIEGREIGSEIVNVKVTDKQSVPKTSAKLVREYNASAIGNEKYAQVLVSTEKPVDNICLSENSRYAIKNIEYNYSSDSKGYSQHLVELAVDSAVNTNKKAEFLVMYDGYQKPAATAVAVKEISKVLAIKSYFAYTLQTPEIYTDLKMDSVKVILDLPKEVYDENVVSEVTIRDGVVHAGSLRIRLADASQLSVIGAAFDRTPYFVEKDETKSLEDAIVIEVQVKDLDKFKKADIKFKVVDESGYWFEGEQNSTVLKLTGKKVSSEKTTLISLFDGNPISTLVFRESLAGKENSLLAVQIPEKIALAYPSWDDVQMSVDLSGDKAIEALMESGALAVEENGTTIQIITTTDAFKVAKGKLQIALEFKNLSNDSVVKTKSASLTLDLRSLSKEPKTTISLKQKGTFNLVSNDTETYVTATVKNVPTGASITGIRFKDVSDYEKYELYTNVEAVQYDMTAQDLASFYIAQAEGVNLPTGKDEIGIVYEFKLMGGAKVEVETSLKLNVTQSAAMKAEYHTNTLYNAAPGFGVYVYVAENKANLKGHGDSYDVIKDVEITNLSELQKAGISVEVNPNNPSELYCYVDAGLTRGKEKTYTVKTKVSIKDGALDKNGAAVTYPLNFKVVLKK